jgi:VIT1/CCC1 family predicted Fe2+/Mn2+ transporter
MDKITFVNRVAIWVAVVAALAIAVIGLCFGRVIEGSLAAEVGKWVLMGLVVIGILEGFVYFLGPLIWHFTYGKRK